MTALSALRDRAKASLIHLAGSVCIAGLAGALVFLLWYPGPYAALAGGTTLFLLIAGVDVVMGPVITFAIFDRRKPATELRRDILIVVFMQLAALGYGLHTMYAARPVVLAFETYRFRVVTAHDVLVEELPQAPSPLQHLSVTGPRVIGTQPPTETNEKLAAIELAMATGVDLGARPKYWRSWDATARQAALAAAKPIAALRERAGRASAGLDAAIAKSGRDEQRLRYLPVISRFGQWIVLLDDQTGDLLAFAPAP